jgi:hypothetical protein
MHRASGRQSRQAELLADAAEALWSYVVQRELRDRNDAEYIRKEHDVPAEVVKAMGP